MTAPRNVRPGVTWFITSRVTRRHFVFRPDEQRRFENLYWYCTAIVAAELGIQIHAACVMSSHLHEVLTDTLGNLSRFFELRNRLLANAVKCMRGWPEEVFRRGGTDWCELVTPSAIVKEMAYTMANPTAAFLVEHPKDWPGVMVLPEHLGTRITATRPTVYFRQDSKQWPDTVSIDITPPEALLRAYGGVKEIVQTVETRLSTLLSEAKAHAKEVGARFQGAWKVLQRRCTDRAKSYEAFGERNPKFAADGDKEAAQTAIERNRQFVHDYRSARAEYANGNRNVVFPFGTWFMRVVYGVNCAPAPT